MLNSSEQKNRIWAFGVLTFFVVVSISSFLYNEYYIYLSIYLWFGLVYGLSLQYGRFCFSSAFRDLFAVGVARMAVGITIAIVLFALVASLVTAQGLSTFHPAPSGIHAIIAGFIFGAGMVFAGGCASGSLYKTGEGNMNALIVVLSISVAQALFVDVGGWANNLVPDAWHQSALAKGLPESINVGDGWMDQYLAGYVWNQPVTTFAKMLGWENSSALGAIVGNFLIGVLLPSVLLLLVVYFVWSRQAFVRKKIKTGNPKITLLDEVKGYWLMLTASKRTAIAGLIIGVAAGLHMLVLQGARVKFGVKNAGSLLERMGFEYGISVNGTVFDPGYWYVTTQEAQWVGWMIQKSTGANYMDNVFFGYVNGIPNPIINPADWMSIATIGGAAIMALLYSEFKFKKPTLELATWAIIGGTLMGLGARLALGCNIGAFFIRVANGDPSGWLFGIGMVPGAYIAVKFFNWWTERKMAKQGFSL